MANEDVIGVSEEKTTLVRIGMKGFVWCFTVCVDVCTCTLT